MGLGVGGPESVLVVISVVSCVSFVERAGTISIVCMRMCNGRIYRDRRLFPLIRMESTVN